MRTLTACLAVVGLALCCAGLARADLVGYWTFDEGSGATLIDITGRGNDGSIVNSPAWAAGHTAQPSDQALAFTGAEYVNLWNPTDLQITGDQTISMWVYPTDFSARCNPYAKAYGGEGTITQEPSGAFNYYYGTGGGNTPPYQSHGSYPLTANAWQHATIVRDLSGNRLRWYVDGKITSRTPNFNPAAASNNNAYFGTGYAGRYIGLIDDAAIWNEALSGLDVLLMTDGLTTPQSRRSTIPVRAYSYSTAPNAHFDYYRDEGKDPDEDGVWDNPTGDLSDLTFLGEFSGSGPDDNRVGWLRDTPVDITFDLQPGHMLDYILIGYSHDAPPSNDGPDDVQISFSLDDITYSAAVTYTGFTGTNLMNHRLIDVDDVLANYVRLSFDGGTAHNLGKYLIDEVAFIQIPEPATMSLLALGGLAALATRRRGRK